MKLWMAITIATTILAGCSSLKRSHQYNTDPYRPGSMYKTPQEIKDEEVSKYEFGYNKYSRELNESEYGRLQQRIYLKRLERNLISRMDKDLYYKNKPFFRNDSERIAFLNIPDYSEKLKWLRMKGFASRVSTYSADEQEAIEQNDVLLHMSMNAVRESWGEPDAREISGSEFHGNEKWTYSNYQSSPEGYQRQNRTIFFENGRVIAWRTE